VTHHSQFPRPNQSQLKVAIILSHLVVFQLQVNATHWSWGDLKLSNLQQVFSHFLAGLPVNVIQQFQNTTNIFCIQLKKYLKLENWLRAGMNYAYAILPAMLHVSKYTWVVFLLIY
jgi:hypothetical protein